MTNRIWAAIFIFVCSVCTYLVIVYLELPLYILIPAILSGIVLGVFMFVEHIINIKIKGRGYAQSENKRLETLMIIILMAVFLLAALFLPEKVFYGIILASGISTIIYLTGLAIME
mgnify:CR=1 FL=1|jgi:hypothetical protein